VKYLLKNEPQSGRFNNGALHRRDDQRDTVERSYRIDEEEFWRRYAGQDFDAASDALSAWEYRYNHERFSMALHGRTPMEKLAAMLAPPLVMARGPDSVQ
jgi:Integrase core domain